MRNYQLIVVGGGSAGHAAARKGVMLGLKTALVEKAGTLGGLCILRGCMPSKTLIATADRMREVRQASEFAVRAGEPELDLDALKARLSELIEGFRSYREKEMITASYDLIRDDACFADGHTIRLADSGETIRGEAFVIASGSRPSVPDIPGLADTPYWTSDDVTRLPRLPASVAIIGTGAVGMESAHLFEGLGSQVTALCRSGRILSGLHADLASTVAKAGKERGVEILFHTEACHVAHEDGRFRLNLSTGGSLDAEALIVATGRSPNTRSLGLEALGLETDDSGRIPIDDHTATTLPHVFAAGDCTGGPAVVHLAVMQGETAARNAALHLGVTQGSHASWLPELRMQAVFTRPEVISLGHDPDTLDEHHEERRYRFADQGKGEILGARHGHVRIVSEKRSNRIVGAHAVGPGVIDSAHVMQMVIANRMTVDQLRSSPFYHPTLVEIWTYAAES